LERRGDLVNAKAGSEKMFKMVATAQSETLVPLFGFDLWMLGPWLEKRLIERGRSSSDPYSTALAMIMAMFIAINRRNLIEATKLN
jgi:hypothetical protein